ncbi:MAG: hypothetical protein A2027_03775 [Thermodesulfovibrio sp. RBG_19FT_COMBO_41_18]|nr:MAG: hypothetical protein A2027_03775 [Thermodesulfovibrio sp. RBG_19FT_COMBO_41_18]
MSELTKTLQKTLLWISMKKEKSLSLYLYHRSRKKLRMIGIKLIVIKKRNSVKISILDIPIIDK